MRSFLSASALHTGVVYFVVAVPCMQVVECDPWRLLPYGLIVDQGLWIRPGRYWRVVLFAIARYTRNYSDKRPRLGS